MAKRLEETPSKNQIVDFSDERLTNSKGELVEQAIREAYQNGSASIELHSEELCQVASELKDVPTEGDTFYYHEFRMWPVSCSSLSPIFEREYRDE